MLTSADESEGGVTSNGLHRVAWCVNTSTLSGGATATCDRLRCRSAAVSVGRAERHAGAHSAAAGGQQLHWHTAAHVRPRMPSVYSPATHPISLFFSCLCVGILQVGNDSHVNSAGGQAMALCRGCWLLMCQVRPRCHVPELVP